MKAIKRIALDKRYIKELRKLIERCVELLSLSDDAPDLVAECERILDEIPERFLTGSQTKSEGEKDVQSS